MSLFDQVISGSFVFYSAAMMATIWKLIVVRILIFYDVIVAIVWKPVMHLITAQHGCESEEETSHPSCTRAFRYRNLLDQPKASYNQLDVKTRISQSMILREKRFFSTHFSNVYIL